MAAIEKICEVCRTYCSYDMYKYKRNLIQICPDCRKTFKGKKVKFIIKSIDYLFVHKRDNCISHSDMSWRKDYRKRKEYLYYIELEDGKQFLNYTTDLTSTIRRLKRLVGSKNFIRVKG